MEHLWADLKVAVHRCFPANLTELERICHGECNTNLISRCAMFVATNPRRLKAVLAVLNKYQLTVYITDVSTKVSSVKSKSKRQKQNSCAYCVCSCLCLQTWGFPRSVLGSTDSCLAQQAPEADHEEPSDVSLSGVSRARYFVFPSASPPEGQEHLPRN